MRVIVFGANGRVGRLVVAELLRRGHNVTAFVHGAGLDDQENLSIIEGDIYNREDIELHLPGHTTVVSTLGSWGTKQQNILSTAMQKIVPCMETNNIRRIVSLTGDGAAAPGDHRSLRAYLSRVLLLLIAPKVLRDGEDHIRILAHSKLLWTVVRSPVMTNAASSRYTLLQRPKNFRISRHAVVESMVDLAESGEWPKAAPFLATGK